jgi:tetratricopeptide (TPR) repeat protein
MVGHGNVVKTPKYYEITDLARRREFDAARAELASSEVVVTESEREELLGNIAFYEKDQQKAVTLYEAVMLRDTTYDCARYHYIVGVKEELKGNLVEASDRYNTAIAVEPTFVDSYIELGGLFARLQDYALAAQVYEDALKIDPNEIRLYFNLCEIYTALWEMDGAYAEKRKAAKRQYKEAKKRLGPLPGKEYKW